MEKLELRAGQSEEITTLTTFKHATQVSIGDERA
jgi:hypothetical protein